MNSTKLASRLGTILLTAVLIWPSGARALTTVEAPTNSDGTQRFTDPDDRVQNNLGGASGQSPRGWSFQVGPAPGTSPAPALQGGAVSDPNSPYYRPASPGMFRGPGMPR